MKLSTRGRYAVMALLELAAYDAGTPITLSVIAERQNLSLSYVELLFAKLRRHGLVKSVRGPGGGYVLAQSADAISIAQIVAIVDPPESAPLPAFTVGAEGNAFDAFLDHYLWQDLNQKMLDYLKGVSLSDLLDKHHFVVQKQTRQRAAPLLHVMRMAS